MAEKEEALNAIKATFEKVLNTERTLKTQVKTLFLNDKISVITGKRRAESEIN